MWHSVVTCDVLRRELDLFLDVLVEPQPWHI